MRICLVQKRIFNAKSEGFGTLQKVHLCAKQDTTVIQITIGWSILKARFNFTKRSDTTLGTTISSGKIVVSKQQNESRFSIF